MHIRVASFSLILSLATGCYLSPQVPPLEARPSDARPAAHDGPRDLPPQDTNPDPRNLDSGRETPIPSDTGVATDRKDSAAGYTLVWAEEFSGPTLDPAIWNIEDRFIEKNQELQYYRAANVSLENGALVLEARQESFGGKSYTSGSITSQNKKTFRYGRMTARIQLPTTTGMWPAFWMLGAKGAWPDCGEIDIMEGKGRLPQVVYGTAHWGPLVAGNHPNYGKTFTFPPNTDTSEWHEYTLEWGPATMVWWVDDHPIYLSMSTIDPFHQDYYFILNLAVGGMFDNNIPPPNPLRPQRMRVDYIRVYQLQ